MIKWQIYFFVSISKISILLTFTHKHAALIGKKASFGSEFSLTLNPWPKLIRFNPWTPNHIHFLRTSWLHFFQFNLSLHLINNSIYLMPIHFRDIPLRGKRSKWLNHSLTLAHQIYQFSIIVSIPFPRNIGNNCIQFTQPIIQPNAKMLRCSPEIRRGCNVIPEF